MRAILAVLVVACASPKPAPAPPTPAPVEAPPPAPAAPDPALVDQGKQLVEKFGCISCHTSDGTPRVGPTFKGYFGMKLTEQDGTVVTGSAERLRKSLEHAPALKDYPPSMPAYTGMISDAEASALVAYVQSL